MSDQSALLPEGRYLSDRTILAIYTLTIFLSALLLFSVQPVFTRLVLPKLGGTPAVWSVAMVFFQAVLLAGYGYAHAMTRYLSPRMSLLVHMVVCGSAFLFLPLALASGWGQPPADNEAIWLVGLFAASLGVPFFAVSANGPLLQAWFARSGHAQADDPYFLYGASNIGSFVALLSYPVLIEPNLRLGTQSYVWTVGFAGLVALLALCGLLIIWRLGAHSRLVQHEAQAQQAQAAASKPTWQDKGWWVLLALVPSAYLVAVTAHISTDIASVPFLWVVPLALFLLTFVLVFRNRPLIGVDRLDLILGYALALLVLLGFGPVSLPIGVSLVLHIGGFFLAAMVCHTRLYAARPASEHLTAFYLWMSFGGVLGGVFAGLLAPNVFTSLLEYPILIVLAFVLRPAMKGGARKHILAALVFLVLGGLAVFIPRWIGFDYQGHGKTFVIAFITSTVLIFTFRKRTVLALSAIIVALIGQDLLSQQGALVAQTRSFFGVSRVLDIDEGRYRIIKSGTTYHGVQRMLDDDGKPVTGRPEPLAYYYPESGMADALQAVRLRAGDRAASIGVIGLGAGVFACNRKDGEPWTYFEIDPEVIRLARDSGLFSFLKTCAPNARIIPGDARLSITQVPEKSFDLLVVDAFSSDAIPMHLLTVEALTAYTKRLANDGVIAMHITNRHLSLRHIIARMAGELGYKAYLRNDPGNIKAFHFPSKVIVLVRDEAHLGSLASNKDWKPVAIDPAIRPWTDDYSNILTAILKKAGW